MCSPFLGLQNHFPSRKIPKHSQEPPWGWGKNTERGQTPNLYKRPPMVSRPSSSPVPKMLPFPMGVIELGMFPCHGSSLSPCSEKWDSPGIPEGSFPRDRKGFANKISFQVQPHFSECRFAPQTQRIWDCRCCRMKTLSMMECLEVPPRQSLLFPCLVNLPERRWRRRERKSSRWGHHKMSQRSRGALSPLGAPTPSLFHHHEHPSSSQTELLPWKMVLPGGREAPYALLPNFLASPRLLRPEPPDPSLASHPVCLVISLWCHMSFLK